MSAAQKISDFFSSQNEVMCNLCDHCMLLRQFKTRHRTFMKGPHCRSSNLLHVMILLLIVLLTSITFRLLTNVE